MELHVQRGDRILVAGLSGGPAGAGNATIVRFVWTVFDPTLGFSIADFVDLTTDGDGAQDSDEKLIVEDGILESMVADYAPAETARPVWVQARIARGGLPIYEPINDVLQNAHNPSWPPKPDRTELRNGLPWEYRAVLTQSQAVAQNADILITPGRAEEFEVDSILFGPDDYAAGRAVDVHRMDNEATKNRMELLMSDADLDNALLQMVQGVVTPATSNTANAVGSKPAPIRISGQQALRLRGAALAQNETLTVYLTGRLRHGFPTITNPDGAQGSTSLATTFNRIAGSD